MTEPAPREDLVANLLAQDPNLSDSQMEEYRMQLEQKIDKAERQAWQMRVAIYVALGTWMIAMAVAPFLKAMGNEMSTTLNVVWLIAIAAAPLCGVWFLIVYLVKYRPAVGQTRTDFQTTVILQLQRQVAELTERLNKQQG